MKTTLELVAEYLKDIPGVSIQPYASISTHKDSVGTSMLVFSTIDCPTPCVAVIQIKGSIVTIHRRATRMSKSPQRAEFDIANPTFLPNLRALVLKIIKQFEKSHIEKSHTKR